MPRNSRFAGPSGQASVSRRRRWVIGVTRRSFADLRSTAAAPLASRDDNRCVYASIEVALDADASKEPRTLAFARYGVANDRINEFVNFFALGLRSRGLIASRPATRQRACVVNVMNPRSR
jgi:hypothetical protein